jgi:CP family cyanate transporter-like MFS transporter
MTEMVRTSSEAVVESASQFDVSSATQMPAGDHDSLSAWMAITAIILVAIDLRPGIVSIGPVLPAISKEFGRSHAGASLLTTIPDLLMGLLALPTPWLARKFGRNGLILTALLLLTVSTVTRAFAHNVPVLLVSTAGVGAGIAIAGASIAGFIKARFSTRAVLLMGIYATALSFGSTVSAAVTGPLALGSAKGWRLATGSWSLLGLTAVIAWSIVTLYERKPELGAPRDAAHIPIPLRNLTAWFVALFFALNNLLFYALLAWIAPLFRELGRSPRFSGLLLATFTASFMCGNFTFGNLSRSRDRRRWLAGCSAVTIAGLIPLAITPNFASFAWISLAGLGLGGGFTLGMTLPLDNTETIQEANVWNAFVLTVGYLVAAMGPLTVGALRDWTGGFALPIWVLVAVTAGMLAITPLLSPHRKPLA